MQILWILSMKKLERNYLFGITASVVVTFLFPPSVSYSQPQLDVQSRVKKISKEISEIRGINFKQLVKVKSQSFNDFGKYLDEAIEKQMPENRLKYYGKIVKKLGLYRGPEIKDFASMTKAVMQNQVAAYYDPESETFYVVMQGLSDRC
jgi:hypothetical protein